MIEVKKGLVLIPLTSTVYIANFRYILPLILLTVE